MAHRRLTCDSCSNDKLSTSVRSNIKDKISLWEAKEPSKRMDKQSEDHMENGGKVVKNNISKCGDRQQLEIKTAVSEELKENVGKLKDSRPCPQNDNDGKKAVFTLFKKLDAMDHGKTPPELGNYFSPASKDKQARGKDLMESLGKAPVNPVPKPERTFQHPVTRKQRNLPPLPKTSSRHPPVLNNKKPLECEDIPGLNSSLRTPEHHYEDILDAFKENPYEDIELESLCSQQSLPSSPGADTSKVSRPGFFRKNSDRSFKLLDLCRASQQSHGSGGVSSPIQLSPPSTPTEPGPWLTGESSSRTCRRIPTVILRINNIFEARIGKKHLRRIYQYAETSSGRVTDENSDSESEFEERAKAHRQRLVSVQSILSRPGCTEVECNSTKTRSGLLWHRQLFEFFLVVSLQRSKAGGHYVPEVTQQFPPKLERNFKFMKETEDQLRIIPRFCFPDAKDWEPVESYPSETFSFVLTGEDGSRRFGYCRRLLPSGKGKRLPEVYCIVSCLGCFNLFSKVLDEVERRRALSPALVQPFMRAIMEAQFPAPGRTITIKTFLPGCGTEVMELCRPSDSHLEHVDFECLFSCLSLRLLLGVFGSLLLERRVIFTADKLSTLSQCCHAVVALLYPFVWQHTYIAVLPSTMLDIVCTPTPFIVGLLSGSLPQLTELPLEEVLVVDLEKNRFLRQITSALLCPRPSCASSWSW
uniref:DENN domain-containing protein 2A-like isoform X1 n=1 Tax=Doryrhamphus excisus TaxID=161450 RepID=UPI0025ADB09B|nr:DENN domain-containing protein 2A-like isoform X1 [Doryrhamphus excisus]XP_057934614.1 DENN domain-containing protein 2A-like isoform X1 [Doryrhamphus excisus]